MALSRLLHARALHPVMLAPKHAYNLWAETYDETENNALLAAEEHALLPMLDEAGVAGMRVIDLGCGVGRHIRHFLDRNVHFIVGVDFSENMLRRASREFSSNSAGLINSSVSTLPLRSSQFDFAIAAFVLSHVHELHQTLLEVHRVLRPHGTLLISDWHPENDRRGWKRTFRIRSASDTLFAVESVSRSMDEYRDALTQAGFRVRKVVEPLLDASLKSIFHRTGMMQVYGDFVGQPIVAVMDVERSG